MYYPIKKGILSYQKSTVELAAKKQENATKFSYTKHTYLIFLCAVTPYLYINMLFVVQSTKIPNYFLSFPMGYYDFIIKYLCSEIQLLFMFLGIFITQRVQKLVSNVFSFFRFETNMLVKVCIQCIKNDKFDDKQPYQCDFAMV